MVCPEFENITYFKTKHKTKRLIVLCSIIIIEPTEQLLPEKQFGGLTEWDLDYFPSSELCGGPWSEAQEQTIKGTVKSWHETRQDKLLQHHYDKVLETLSSKKYCVQLEVSFTDEADAGQLMNDVDDLWLDYLEPTCKPLGLTITYYHIITLGDNTLQVLATNS